MIFYLRHSAFLPLLLVIALVFELGAQTASYHARQFTQADGLSQDVVYTVLQDRKGYMWFGTLGGLTRFDGYTYLKFQHSYQDSTTLKSNLVRSLVQGSSESIWIGTYKGLNKLDLRTLEISNPVAPSSRETAVEAGSVKSLVVDSAGIVWVGTTKGLYQMIANNGDVLSSFPASDSPLAFDSCRVENLELSPTGTLWVATKNAGLFAASAHNSRVSHIPQVTETHVTTLLDDSESGILWVGTLNGIIRYDLLTNEIRRHPLAIGNPNGEGTPERVISIQKRDKRFLWIGTAAGGVLELDLETWQTNKIQYSATRNDFDLYESRVSEILFDRNGIYWLSTDSGICMLDSRAGNLRYVRVNNQNTTSAANMVTSVAEDPYGFIWLGTTAGVNRYNPANENIVRFSSENRRSGIRKNDITDVECDKYGNVWISDFEGVLKYDRNQNRFVPAFYENSTAVEDMGVLSISEDSTGHLWLGMVHGVVRFNVATESSIPVYAENTAAAAKISAQVFTVVDAHQDNFWIGTSSGLFHYDESEQTIRPIFPAASSSAAARELAVFAITVAKDNHVWLATHQGLARYNPASDQFTDIRSSSSLRHEAVMGLVQDDDHNLWLAGQAALYRVSFQNGDYRISRYASVDEVRIDGFNFGAQYVTDAGELVLGGPSGACILDPVKYGNGHEVPLLVFSDMFLFNDRVSIGEEYDGTIILDEVVDYKTRVELDYSQNFFGFGFTALDYSQGAGTYSHILEGIDREWQQIGSHRQASYTNIPAGEYVFSVRYLSGNASSVDQVRTIEIIVHPPFWQTWWFILAALFGCVGIVYALIGYRTRLLLSRARLLEESVAARTRELSTVNADLNAEIEHRAKVERDLEEYLALVKATLEATAAGILVTDQSGKIINYNSKFARMWKVPNDPREMQPDELEQFLNDQIVPPDNLTGQANSQNHGQSGSAIDEIRANDGRFFERYSQSQRVDGEIVGRVVSFNDVTKHKEAEVALKESAQLYRAVIEEAPDGIYIADENGRILEANPAYQALLGYSREQLLALTVYDTVAHPRESVDFHMNQILTRSTHFATDRQHRRQDGSTVDVEVSTCGITYAGKRAFCAVVRDITERVAATQKIKELQQFYGHILDCLPIQVTVYNAAGEHIYANPAKLAMGTDTSENGATSNGNGSSELSPIAFQIQPSQQMTHIRNCLSSGKILDVEESNEDPSGVTRHRVTTFVPMPDVNKNQHLVVGYTIDVTERKRASEALKQSEERYRTLYQYIPAMYFTLDESGVVISVNEFGAGQLGYTPEELIGESVLKVFHPDDRPQLLLQMQSLLKTRTSVSQWMLRKIHRNGRILWVEEYARTIPASGDQINVLVVCNDITDRKWAEDALRSSEERYRLLFNYSLDPIMVHEVTREGVYSNFVQVNPRASEVLGYSQNELLTMDPSSLVPERFKEQVPQVHLDLHEKSRLRFETHLRNKIGDEFVFEVNAHMFELHGRPTVLSIYRDITERKKTVRVLKQSEIRLQTLLAKVPGGVAVISSSGKVLFSNPAIVEMVDYTPEQIAKMDSLDFVHPEDRKRASKRIEALLLGADQYASEYRVLTGKGQIVHVETHSRIIEFDNEQALLIFVYDLSERKRMEEELRNHRGHLEELIQRRTGELSRSREELRNLSARLETMREEERRRISRKIHDELGQVLSALKIDLLWLDSHFSTDETQLFEKTASMSKLIESTISTVQRISQELRPPLLDDIGFTAAVAWYLEEFAERTGLEIRVKLMPESINLARDVSVVLFRIMQETLTNVTRHAKAKSVEVILRRSKRKLKFIIADDGVGITPEQIAGPTSLGLIGMRERILFLNGTIDFVNDNGTRVEVTIPLKKGEKVDD